VPEFDLQALFRAFIEQLIAEAHVEAEQVLLYGNGAGAPLGFRAPALREPTSAERAFAILAPHLDDVPLYRPDWKTRP
jgi:hypothetical protein